MKGDPGHSMFEWQAVLVVLGLALGLCLTALAGLCSLIEAAWRAVR